MVKSLTLTGMMGVGKSTTGKNLAKKLNYNFFDVDELIENKEGMSINLIFQNKSESYFRKIESETTISLLNKKRSVISLGGGAFLNNSLRKSIKRLTVSFWLDVPIDLLVNRLKWSKKRPLLNNRNTKETIKKLYFERKKIYSEADFKIKCKSFKTDIIVDKILKYYENSRNQI